MRLHLSALIAGIGTILAAMPASAAPSTCASLRSMSIPNVTISAAELISPPASPGRGAPTAPPAAGAGRAVANWSGRAGASGVLPRPAAPHTVIRFAHQRGALAAERQRGTAGSWRSATAGSAGSIQGFGEMQNALRLGYATSGNDTGPRHGRGWPERHVCPRPPGKDRRLRVPRHARDDRHVEVDHPAVLRPAAAVLVLQGLLDRRTPGRDERAALSRRFRRHHRRRAGESAHPDAHGRRARAASSWRGIPRGQISPATAQMVTQGRDEGVRHAEGRLPHQPARLHVRLHEARLRARAPRPRRASRRRS